MSLTLWLKLNSLLHIKIVNNSVHILGTHSPQKQTKKEFTDVVFNLRANKGTRKLVISKRIGWTGGPDLSQAKASCTKSPTLSTLKLSVTESAPRIHSRKHQS